MAVAGSAILVHRPDPLWKPLERGKTTVVIGAVLSLFVHVGVIGGVLVMPAGESSPDSSPPVIDVVVLLPDPPARSQSPERAVSEPSLPEPAAGEPEPIAHAPAADTPQPTAADRAVAVDGWIAPPSKSKAPRVVCRQNGTTRAPGCPPPDAAPIVPPRLHVPEAARLTDAPFNPPAKRQPTIGRIDDEGRYHPDPAVIQRHAERDRRVESMVPIHLGPTPVVPPVLPAERPPAVKALRDRLR